MLCGLFGLWGQLHSHRALQTIPDTKEHLSSEFTCFEQEGFLVNETVFVTYIRWISQESPLLPLSFQFPFLPPALVD